jgi:hypothetical protein
MIHSVGCDAARPRRGLAALGGDADTIVSAKAQDGVQEARHFEAKLIAAPRRQRERKPRFYTRAPGPDSRR